MKTMTVAFASAVGRSLLLGFILLVFYGLLTLEFSKASSQTETKRYLRMHGADVQEMELETRPGANSDDSLLRHLSGHRPASSRWKEMLYLYQAKRTDGLAETLQEQDQAQLIAASYEHNPANPLLLYRNLLRSIAHKENRTAIEQSQQLLAMVPQFGPAARISARLLLETGDRNHQVVTDLYHQSLSAWQSSKDFNDSLLELFRILRSQQRESDVVRIHVQVRDEVFLSPAHELVVAYSHLALGQREQSLKLFKTVAQSERTADKTARQALFMQAVIREQQERFTDALLILTGSTAEARFHSALPYELHRKASMVGHLAGKLDAKDVAPAYFTKAMGILPGPSSSGTLVTSLARRNEANRALEILLSRTGRQTCWKQASDIQDCMVQLVSSPAAEAAQPAFEQLLLSPEGRKQLLDIAHGLRRSNDFQTALSLYDQLATTAPNREERRAHLQDKAVTHAQAGQHDSAARSYLEAHQISPDEQSWMKALRASHRIRDWKALENLFAQESKPHKVSQQIQALACRTQAELGKLDSAFACYHGFAKQNPRADRLIREGVSLADRHERPETAISLLELIKVRKSPEELLDLGYRYAAIKFTEKAETNFQLSYQRGHLAEAGLAFALSALKRGRIALADFYLQEIQDARSLSRTDQRLVNASLAHIHAESENHRKAAQYWQEALAYGDSPEFRVKLSNSLLQVGEFEDSWKNLELVASNEITGRFSGLYHDLHAEHALHRGHKKLGLIHRKYALDVDPTAARYLSLVTALKQAGELDEALHYLGKAEKAFPEKTDFKVEQAYLHSQQKNDEEAAKLLYEALEQDPDYPGARANLAFTYLRLGHTEQAGKAFRRAMDEGNYAVISTKDADGASPRNVLQNQHRELDRPYSLSLTNSFCFPKGMACQRLLNPFGDSHDLSYGQLAMSWRPMGGGSLHRWSHLVELTARLFWSNAPGFNMMNSESAQAALGLRAYPFRGRNYWLGAERILPIGDSAISGWLLRVGFSESLGDNWKRPDHPFRFYAHTHSEASRLFSKDDQTSAFSEGRAGLAWQPNRKLMFLPFGYVRGGGQITQSSERRREEYERDNTRTVVLYPDTTGDVWIEGGMGLSARWRFNHDRYNGYLSQGKTLLRLGRDLHTTWSDPATRFSLLFQVSF
ncbi:tetratricopeptide repeat protein [Fodinicurvata sediminis]|uniref:tetratricopeptide repeat protein n=1 Tax=Fodinicurvata sediminis TaxID=1121832 RepID=UPI0003B702C6|nr:tetratricopeptide repeat protein [Fodinicurvata sediminis]